MLPSDQTTPVPTTNMHTAITTALRKKSSNNSAVTVAASPMNSPSSRLILVVTSVRMYGSPDTWTLMPVWASKRSTSSTNSSTLRPRFSELKRGALT